VERAFRRSHDSTHARRVQPGWRQIVLGLLPSLAAVAVVLFFYSWTSHSSGERSAAQAHELTYPASLISETAQPDGDEWLLPSAAVRIDDLLYVVDTGYHRVLVVDLNGHVVRRIDATTDSRLRLQQPLAIASDGKRLFIASSDPGEIVVTDLEGRVERVITPPLVQPNERPIRPIGLAVTASGTLVVADANNSRVLLLDEEGGIKAAVGTGARADGEVGFNVPSGLAVDRDGYIYVVDTLNGRVVQLSPTGEYVKQLGSLGGSAGNLSRPKGVAVDREGRVFVSDTIMAAVVVFDPGGTYLGAIGRRVRTDPQSDLVLEAPAGLWLSDDQLYVTDRYAGLVTFKVGDQGFRPASPSR